MPDEILIVQPSPDVAAVLEELLTDEGYDTAVLTNPAAAARAVRESEPDALALGLPPRDADAGRLLDELRTDPVARRVPILAMSTVPSVAERARASYNVRATLEQPFGVDQAIEQAARTVADPPVQAQVGEAESDGPAARIEPIVAAQSRGVLLDWVERVRSEVPEAGGAQALFPDLLGETPTVVDALDAALRLSEPATLFDRPEVAERIAAYARERRDRGLDLDTTVAGLRLLGDGLWRAVQTRVGSELSAEDADAVRRTLDGLLERVVALAGPVYEERPAA